MQTILDASFAGAAFGERPVPARAGVGLKPQHIAEILDEDADIGFFEVHAENYMGAGGMPHAQLHAIRERHALSVHGVGMSIGGEGRIDPGHLARFKAVVDLYRPGLVSEHLAWSTHDDIFFNDLLPLPYTSATLARVVDHVSEVQEAIGRQILIENPSTYVVFSASTWGESDFMAEIARRSGCGLLFDVNNVYVSAANHGFSPRGYIADYPLHLVQEIHLAGHASDSDDAGRTLLIDAHDREVSNDVWDLYRYTLARTGPLPTLIEWDNDVPQWHVLQAEASRAEAMIQVFRREAAE
jgi:uncharacterized protein (UPF0276 family)